MRSTVVWLAMNEVLPTSTTGGHTPPRSPSPSLPAVWFVIASICPSAAGSWNEPPAPCQLSLSMPGRESLFFFTHNMWSGLPQPATVTLWAVSANSHTASLKGQVKDTTLANHLSGDLLGASHSSMAPVSRKCQPS